MLHCALPGGVSRRKTFGVFLRTLQLAHGVFSFVSWALVVSLSAPLGMGVGWQARKLRLLLGCGWLLLNKKREKSDCSDFSLICMDCQCTLSLTVPKSLVFSQEFLNSLSTSIICLSLLISLSTFFLFFAFKFVLL